MRRLATCGAVLMMSACTNLSDPTRFGAAHGPKADLTTLLADAELLPKLSLDGEPSAETKNSFLKDFFGSAYNGSLVDLVYFVDVPLPHAPAPHDVVTVHVALTRGELRPRVVEDIQSAWALVVFAVPRSGTTDDLGCITATLLDETIAQPESPSETGVLSAVLSLTKLGSKQDDAQASKDTTTQLVSPSDKCKQPSGEPKAAKGGKPDDAKGEDATKHDGAAPFPNDDVPEVDMGTSRFEGVMAIGTKPKPGGTTDDAKKADSPPPPMTFRLLGKTADRFVYAALIKLDVPAATTNRVVLVSSYKDAKKTETSVPDAVITFRNATHPSFRSTVALGARLETTPERTTSGETQRGHLYDPDLYILVHWLFPFERLVPCARDWILEHELRSETYPSLFIGTNLLSRSPLTDVVGGVRIPFFFYNKIGTAVGFDWSSYNFNTVNSCVSSCVVHSARRFGWFFGLDYDF